MAVEDGVERHLVRKVLLLEVGGLLLKLFQRVQSTFLETELAVANQTPRAVPLGFRLDFERRVEAIAVVPMVARLAGEKEAALFVTFAALFASLFRVSIGSCGMAMQLLAYLSR
jgi:hypothetical protein